MRLPYRWERLQPSLFGNLNQTELARITSVVNAAAERHIQIILSPHNFGRYIHDGTDTLIGTSGVPISAFVDFSNKVARAFAGNGAIYGLNLMNEPHDSRNLWKQTAQAGLDAIRRADGSRLVLAPGDQWGWGLELETFNDGFLLDDPAARVIYEARSKPLGKESSCA